MNEEQRERYNRHITLNEVGEEGQERILKAKVLVVGAGGLGSPVLMYLAAAGVGTIGIVDADTVDVTNLQRQVIHTLADTGRLKAESARETIEAMNRDVAVETHAQLLTAQNARYIIARYDFVIDATDNFAAKYLINDTCVDLGKPFSHGAISQFGGQVFTYVPGSASLRDIFAEPPLPADINPNKGVLGAIPGITGTIQAAEALKYITGAGRLLTDRLLTFDALTMEFRVVKIA
jgi:molybdopterin/thiamine biosynthesis adenylyltransferase